MSKMSTRFALACCLALLPLPAAQAHPHIFVDTALRFVLDDQRNVTGVEVTWTYDDFFTLLIFEDMGLDPDGDAQLTEAELARLKGFDLIEWPPGFEGDLYAYARGQKIEMPRPTPVAVEITPDARIRATHFRPIPPVPAAALEIQQYDPTYYVAYDVTGEVTASGGCRAQVVQPDLDEAERILADLLKEDPEYMFEVVEVGVYYADTIRFDCGA